MFEMRKQFHSFYYLEWIFLYPTKIFPVESEEANVMRSAKCFEAQLVLVQATFTTLERCSLSKH